MHEARDRAENFTLSALADAGLSKQQNCLESGAHGLRRIPTHRGLDRGRTLIAMHLPTCRWALPSTDLSGDLITRVLAARGLTDEPSREAFLHSSLSKLPDPALLPGVSQAATHTLEAVKDGCSIAIYGDYDVDGVTSTAILWHVLRAIDPTVRIRWYIPHRVDEGYGLNSNALRKLHEQGTKLVITVDCGVTAIEEVAYAKSLGMDVIITDHHTPDDHSNLPDATAIVHPALPGSDYPWPHLSGSAVAWKLAWQMAKQHTGSDRVGPTLQAVLMDTMCLAGLGVIADVMPLLDENRIIAKASLGHMHRCRLPGIAALLRSCMKDGEKVDSEAVAFRIAPRLNAAGRLEHARIALDLLITDDVPEADRIAAELTALNTKRQKVVKDIEEEAKRMVEESDKTDPDQRAIVLKGKGWNPGVIGIVCSRLVDRYHRPVVLVCDSGTLKGSARSIDGFSMYDALAACNAHFESFGGHAMAAGLTVTDGQFEAFREAFLAYAAAKLKPEDLIGSVTIDAHVQAEELTPKTINSLDVMRPFGRGNPGPRVLLKDVEVTKSNVMGKHSSHLDMRLGSLRCVWWGRGDLEQHLQRGCRIDVVGRPVVDSWRGARRVQLVIEDAKLVD